ncbi:hypothetical protein B9Z51_15235 [Limnohabitans sp. T6-5]|uniref:hypothetical protein n=1 Tax=Limnohabitans sp. T6-5 TaxID=1100724 RepID=UPI000D37DACA|nr:hypothetical protein [Limnohabitans sp. T6-5]PUE07212.1 hypothetical protein B9Z51_15235 [Limnohabitans sp. T6-5]
MKRLKPYYFFVGLPILLVLLGFVFFYKEVAGTMRGNPHPQINYLIFILMAVGAGMMLHAVHRMNGEGAFIQKFFRLARDGATPETLREMVLGERYDVSTVLEFLAETQNAPISDVQHAALESEVHRFESRQNMRLYLPQFLSGAMVGLGLLGTFIGLLGALEEIGKLISAFTMVESGNAAAAVRTLVDRLSAPMKAMGVAFSASLFGVLGSLIMSVLMVGVKRCSSELVAAMHSRLVYLTDFTTHAAPENKQDQLTASLNVVAEQSPILKALTVALEQSERRVRDLITSLGTLSARIERNEVQLWAELSEGFKANQQGQNAMLENLHQTVQAVREIAREVTPAAYRENAVVAALVTQQNRLESVLQVMESSYGQFNKSLTQQSEVLLRQEQSGQELVQLRQAMADQQRGIQQALNALGSSFASLDSVIREHQELMVHQRATDDVHSSQLASALREEGEILNRLIGRIEALQHEQGAQQERHLSLLVQELRAQPPAATS